MERLLAPKRRWLLLTTLATITVMYTWSSVQQLAILIEAEPELPASEPQSLLRLAEQNIASHLHIKQGVSSKPATRGTLGCRCCGTLKPGR